MLGRLARYVVVVLILRAMLAAAASAPADVAGTYANLSFNVDGAGGQNRLMPRLELHSDGTYNWGRESGKYEYRAGEVTLSGSYAAWGPGRVNKDYQIRFEFTKQGKRYTVTMYRVSAD